MHCQREAKTITDHELLMLINWGELRVTDLESRQPTVIHRGRQLKPTLMGTENVNGTRYRVEIRRKMRKRTIALAKLVWMFVHRKVVGREENIHHKDEDR